MAGTLRWFGHRYDAPAWIDMPGVETPTDQACLECGDPIRPDDDGVMIPLATTGDMVPFHVTCFLLNVGVTEAPKPIP